MHIPDIPTHVRIKICRDDIRYWRGLCTDQKKMLATARRHCDFEIVRHEAEKLLVAEQMLFWERERLWRLRETEKREKGSK